ncbi:hypothetical protein [Streptomyces sp. NPDC060194]|uniref:DUF6197 family protein n=1 Tax=Streptomyces sp. NPDC060194 TaxID=3347069 RepID=UPI003662D32E
MSITLPTSLPSGDRRPVLVTGIKTPAPTTVSGVFRAAARLLAANGHYQGDYLPDPFDRRTSTPHASRPLSIVAALRCVTTGDPHQSSPLADRALSALAPRLEVNGEGPFWGDLFSLEFHVAAWGDIDGRTTESAAGVLYAAADACEVTA